MLMRICVSSRTPSNQSNLTPRYYTHTSTISPIQVHICSSPSYLFVSLLLNAWWKVQRDEHAAMLPGQLMPHFNTAIHSSAHAMSLNGRCRNAAGWRS